MNQELERFEPAEARGRIAYEHLHRYALCSDRVGGLRVLDVACGVGYGSNLLAEVAAEVVGLDIDSAVIRRASKKYRRENLKFVTGDCANMPFEAESFDVVVANEMIEHIEDQHGFLAEVKRVLKAGGTLLISTPNKPIYNRYKSPNPFHVSEMNIAEFRRLLKRHFRHVHFSGLRMALVSATFDLEGHAQRSNLASAKTYRGVSVNKRAPQIRNEELSLDDPEYILATCSDATIESGLSHSSIFFSTEDDLWLEHEKIMAWASQLHEEDEVLRADLRDARSEVDEAISALEETKRENELSSGEARRHLAVSARLLGRLTGAEVEADPTSLLEAMFVVNEQIVTQKARLEMLEKSATKLEHLERELEHKRAAQELQVRELKREHLEARARLEEQFEERRQQLAQELESNRGEKDQLSEELRRTKIRLEELQRHARRRDDERDKVVRAAEERAAELDRELNAAKTALAQLRSDGTALPPREGQGSSKGPVAEGATGSSLMRRRSRLLSSHREIHQQLSRARAALREAIPAYAPARMSLMARLKGRRSVRRCAAFDPKWVESQLESGEAVSFSDFIQNENLYRVDPHPLFSSAYYLERNPDVLQSGMSPLQHYLDHGWREGRDPHPYFANDWYLLQNPDVVQAGLNPLCHYLEHGWKEGRRPNPVFDPVEYLNRHPDVKKAGIDPLTHFVMHGLEEGRDIPFLGLEGDWRSLVPSNDAKSLMDLLLNGTVEMPVSPSTPADVSRWPATQSDFWIPQALRDFMVERGWEGLIPLFTHFYSVMDAYVDAAEDFPNSAEFAQLLERARFLSAAFVADHEKIPEASVIIPVYNNSLDTLLCIVSLLETQAGKSFEIIVADDCSTDATAQLIPQIGGVVRYLRQPQNLGFVGNCNQAADQARGKTLIFLNNDTLTFPGWLENLLAPIRRSADVGLVGSKLISWDGRLQEAGGVFWKDGSAWNFGRGQNATDSEFNYLKDVDYCSGASIAVPSKVWRDVGGFDPAYSPAYCEDSDLAFRVRAAGLRTLYSPHSELIHHEGRSHGRDTSTGIKSFQVANQKRFFARWRDVLERDHLPNGERVLLARDRSMRKPHILVVDHYVPQFDKDAGSRTMFQFLETLIDCGWAVTFWPENLYHDPDYTNAVENIGVEVIYGPRFVGKFSDFLRGRSGLYDAVLLSRPHVAVHFIDDVKTLTNARIVYYGHDVHFERMAAQHEIAGNIEESAVEAMRAMEVGLCDRCNVILYPSRDEAELMASLVSKDVQSRAIPAYSFSEEEMREAKRAVKKISPLGGKAAQLLFVGGFSHGPNVDGVVWFCREVAPLLRRDGFNFELKIAGSNPTGDVWDLESEDTHILGFVTDEKLAQLYREATIVIAPLRFGAGVKGKVIEAMAKGVPVTATTAGAQGIEGAGELLFIGDSAEDFAAAVRSATEEEAGRQKAARALDFVSDHYSRSAMMAVFKEVLPCAASVRRAA